ncbi:Unknown protein, partial [Striga hermonthica]
CLGFYFFLCMIDTFSKFRTTFLVRSTRETNLSIRYSAKRIICTQQILRRCRGRQVGYLVLVLILYSVFLFILYFSCFCSSFCASLFSFCLFSFCFLRFLFLFMATRGCSILVCRRYELQPCFSYPHTQPWGYEPSYHDGYHSNSYPYSSEQCWDPYTVEQNYESHEFNEKLDRIYVFAAPLLSQEEETVAWCARPNQPPPYHDSWDFGQTLSYLYEQQWDSWPVEQPYESLEDSSEYNAKLDQALTLLASQEARRRNLESRIEHL